MYYALAQLICDGVEGTFACGAHFPSDGAANASLFTRRELRDLARDKGWKLALGRDLCPTCVLRESTRKGGK